LSKSMTIVEMIRGGNNGGCWGLHCNCGGCAVVMAAAAAVAHATAATALRGRSAGSSKQCTTCLTFYLLFTRVIFIVHGALYA
jgi:hypothetical protein